MRDVAVLMFSFHLSSSTASVHAARTPGVCAGVTGGMLHQPASHQHKVSCHVIARW